jgi:hypothetical protein
VLSVILGSVRDLHKGWAWFVIIGNGLAGVWSLAAHRYPQFRSRALWWFIAIAELSMFVQVVLGTYMVASQKFIHPKFHSFYGFVGIIAIGILYSYRRQLKSRMYLLYGYGSLFVMGLGIRAMLVGAVVTG